MYFIREHLDHALAADLIQPVTDTDQMLNIHDTEHLGEGTSRAILVALRHLLKIHFTERSPELLYRRGQ